MLLLYSSAINRHTLRERLKERQASDGQSSSPSRDVTVTPDSVHNALDSKAAAVATAAADSTAPDTSSDAKRAGSDAPTNASSAALALPRRNSGRRSLVSRRKTKIAAQDVSALIGPSATQAGPVAPTHPNPTTVAPMASDTKALDSEPMASSLETTTSVQCSDAKDTKTEATTSTASAVDSKQATGVVGAAPAAMGQRRRSSVGANGRLSLLAFRADNAAAATAAASTDAEVKAEAPSSDPELSSSGSPSTAADSEHSDSNGMSSARLRASRKTKLTCDEIREHLERSNVQTVA